MKGGYSAGTAHSCGGLVWRTVVPVMALPRTGGHLRGAPLPTDRHSSKAIVPPLHFEVQKVGRHAQNQVRCRAKIGPTVLYVCC
jgi:hypothetical protein